MDQLKTQTLAIEPKVREGVDKAAITGAKQSGVALLTYMVAIHGDKITVDETGFDSEKTTLKNESLVQCLHETSKAMTFEGLPRNAKEIWVSRQVTLENGKLVENKHVSFSYNPYIPK